MSARTACRYGARAEGHTSARGGQCGTVVDELAGGHNHAPTGTATAVTVIMIMATH